MQHTNTITLSLALMAVVGCKGYRPPNSCEVEVLRQFLNEQELANCDECNSALECPDEVAETGEDEPEGPTPPEELCELNLNGTVLHDHAMCFAFVSNLYLDRYGYTSIYDCDAKSPRYDSVAYGKDNWARHCWSNVPAQEDLDASDLLGWRLCRHDPPLHLQDQGFHPSYRVATLHANPASDNWLADLECPGSDTAAGTCPRGLVNVAYGIDTCACETDADCQIGAVCESGWKDNGNGLRPTMCTWDGAVWDTQGPAAYDLDAFERGFLFDGATLVIDHSVYPKLVQGLLNDAVSWSDEGVITRCDDHSLCGWLGFEVGNHVSVPLGLEATLLSGEPAMIEVDHGEWSEDITVVIGQL
jgi:hypothetical protein